ncbi:unnamed protein product [Alternaria alternata]
MTSETQRALLQVWADDIGHVVDLNNSPKAEFARLGKAKGWIGGSPDWCYHWEKCFSETYSWGVHNLASQTDTPDLTNHMRKLSVNSDASSFSVISRTSRANSFGSVRSLCSDRSGDGGYLRISVGSLSRSIADSQCTVLSLNTVKSLDELSGGVEILNYDQSISMDAATDDGDTCSNMSGRENLEEFERLARIKGWDRRTKRQNLITLLRTEVEFYWSSNDVDKLECYQYLCREMGIERIPCTVTQARKALRPLKVNLYSVIDHMRNQKTRIITYKTMRELRLSVRKIGTFPRDCAKAGGGYMAALLSKL